MMKNEAMIRALLERYDEGLTTDEEERTLRRLLAEEAQLPHDLRAAAALFEGFDDLGEELLPERIEHIEHIERIERIERPLSALQSAPKTSWWGSALFGWSGWAVAAVLAVGLVIALNQHTTPYCYINGVAIYDLDVAMESTACLASLDQLDRSMELFDNLLLTTENE